MASIRQLEARRERIAFEREFHEQQRSKEDREQYDVYVADRRKERLEPLSFEEWRKFIPEEFKDHAPELRGAAASARSTWKETAVLTRDTVAKHRLADEALAELGFDLRLRRNYEFEPLSTPILVDIFTRFRHTEPRFVPTLHLEPISECLSRNQVAFTTPHIRIAWELLLTLGIIQLPEPEPEAKRPEGVNEHGVNLQIAEKDPKVEAERKRREYGTKVVAVGPDGTEYTQFALDRLSADDYKTVMRLVGDRLPKFSNVIVEG